MLAVPPGMTVQGAQWNRLTCGTVAFPQLGWGPQNHCAISAPQCKEKTAGAVLEGALLVSKPGVPARLPVLGFTCSPAPRHQGSQESEKRPGMATGNVPAAPTQRGWRRGALAV